jgi:hypothetical protein
MKLFKIAIATAVIMAALPASASVFMLDFEGIEGVNPQVGDFYNGGAGVNYGVSFAGAQAWHRSDWGNLWSNEPSPDSILVFSGDSNPNDTFLNYAAGFSTGFSFFYTSAGTSAVTVYDGLNGTGNVLATMNLLSQVSIGSCPNNAFVDVFCNWTNAGMSFDGTALSVRFDQNGSNGNIQGFDNVTFGSAVASVAAVPEPETYALMLAGLAVVGAAAKRKARRAQ